MEYVLFLIEIKMCKNQFDKYVKMCKKPFKNYTKMCKNLECVYTIL